VDVALVLQTLAANSTAAKDTVAALPAALQPAAHPCAQGCDHALDFALMTAPDKRDPDVMARLDAVAGRVLTP
jgi:5'-methylthioadenosine phosphorylase